MKVLLFPLLILACGCNTATAGSPAVAWPGKYSPASVFAPAPAARTTELPKLAADNPRPAAIPDNTAAWSDWTEIGAGGMWLSTKQEHGGKVFIGYSGYGAYGAGARNWARTMAEKGGFTAVVAAAGPEKLFYETHEKISANNQLLLGIIPALAPEKITIAAHSSGSFVGRELMALIETNGLKPLLKKISYHDIDASAYRCTGAWCLHGWLINRRLA